MNPLASSPSPQALPAPAAVRAEARPLPLSSAQLLRGQRLVEITHNGEIYRLQATRQGKLILTK